MTERLTRLTRPLIFWLRTGRKVEGRWRERVQRLRVHEKEPAHTADLNDEKHAVFLENSAEEQITKSRKGAN